MRALRSTARTFVLISGLLLLGAAGPAAAEAPSATPPAGLMFAIGGGALQPAPVLGSVVHLRVTGTLARATVTQIFVNPGRKWLEAVYLFPLADGAAVDGLHLRVGERVIDGRIEERREAQETYETAAGEGRKATLVEQGQANLFTTRVANVGPGERVEVEIELQQEVRWADGHFELRFPTVVAPHYEPRIPESAAEPPLSCPRPQPLLTVGGEPVDPIGFRVDLDPGFPLARLASPSHAIAAGEARGGRWTVELADGAVPADADFVLDWWPQAGREPRAVAYTHTVDGEPYALLMVMPPAAAAAPVRLPRETVFVIDTSGSMQGPKLEQARAALVTALGRLQPQDRFNVIRFSSAPEPLFPAAVPADPAPVAQAQGWVSALEVNGGTEMLTALEAALADQQAGDAVRQVVFVTDGEVGRETDLFRYIAQHLGRSRLFTVGIGAAPNAHFMERAAHFGRGSYTYIDDLGDVEGKMTGLLARLEAPVLTDLEVDWDGLAAESFPDPIPDLYLGEPVVVAARLPGAAAAMRVSGWRDGERWEVTLPLAGAADSPAVARLWARKKVAALMDSLTEAGAGEGRNGSGAGGAGTDPAAVRDEVVQLGLRHRLVTAYTSLVAVEETPSAPAGTVPLSLQVPVNPPRDSSSWGDTALQEVITVTSESPLLDERRITVGTTVSQHDLDRLPTARDPWAILQETPGVMADRISVGGLGAPAVAGPGAPPAQATWAVDGVTIGGSGASSGPAPAAYYDFDGFEEMQVASGGSDVQAATPGVRVDLVTRRGTNSRRAAADLQWTAGQPAAGGAAPGVEGGDRTLRQATAGGDAGGPLAVDRLWLWAAARTTESDGRATGGDRHDAAADSVGAKLNAQLGGSASGLFQFHRGGGDDRGLGADPRRAPESTWEASGASEVGKTELTYVLSSNLYLTATLDRVEAQRSAAPRGGTAADVAVDAAGVARRSFFGLEGERRSRHGGLDGHYFLGSDGVAHELSFGAARRRLEDRSRLAAPGRGLEVSAGEVFGLPEPLAVVEAWRDGAAAGGGERRELWLQDLLSFGRWTVQAGVRFDRQELFTRAAAVAASPFAPGLLPAVDAAGGARVAAWETAVPRVGVTRALSGDRRTLLRASLGRFAAPIDAAVAARVHPAAAARALYLFADADADLALGEDELASLTFRTPLGFDPQAAAVQPSRFDPGLGPELTDEAIVAVEHAFRPQLVGALSLTLRRRSDLFEERLLVRDAATGEVFAATAGDWVAAGEVRGTLPDGSAYAVPWFDLHPGLSSTGGTLTVNGDRTQDSHGLTLSLTRRFSGRWQGRGHLSWSEARWRLGPDFRRFDDPTDAAASGDDDGARVAEATGGLFAPAVFLDSRWSLHLDGMVALPRGFHLAAMLDARQGYPLPYSSRLLRPAAGPAELQLTGAIDSFRAPDLVTLDARADKDFTFGDALLTLSLEAFNLLDQGTVLRRQLDLGLTSAAAVEETQRPRTLRVGVRLRWR
jgi:Ca-activated chloride channel homolog